MNRVSLENLIGIIQRTPRLQGPQEPPPLPQGFAELLFPGALEPLSGIRGVFFDIYGTLLTSAAGEIGVDLPSSQQTLDALALDVGTHCTGPDLEHYFRTAVLNEHLRQYPHTPYPEVRSETLWAAFPEKKGTVDPWELALRYELAVNPCAPMPQAAETLEILRGQGLIQGLISNAQFYTPLMLALFFGFPLPVFSDSMDIQDSLGPFDRDLQVYSYQVGQSKPSPLLFQVAETALNRRGLKPEETIFVGNDMLNDIFGASQRGFKTVLFAGDGRSLRLREDNRLCRGLRPTAVIRNLGALPELLGLSTEVPPGKGRS